MTRGLQVGKYDEFQGNFGGALGFHTLKNVLKFRLTHFR